MIEDNKKHAPNKKAGSDARALASAPLLGRNITDEEGAAPEENSLAAVAGGCGGRQQRGHIK